MAATDEFPRGWTQVSGPGYQPSVTFPAVSGVMWVLTEIDLLFSYNGGGAGSFPVECTLTATPSPITGLIYFNATAGQVASETWSWAGKLIAAPRGSNLTIATTFNTGTGTAAILTASAYPI